MPRLDGVMRQIRRLVGGRPPADSSDRDLLERFARQRDQDAFALLVERHGVMVFEVCRRLLRDEQQAEDALQATFLVLARKAGALAWQESVAGWLHAVATRIALKERALLARRRAHEREAATMSVASAKPEPTWNDLKPILDREVANLPARYRAAVVLCYLEGKSCEDAAELLGCPKGTVFTRLSRGRELLRRRLTRQGLTLSSAALPALIVAQAPAAALCGALTRTLPAAAAAFADGQAAPVSVHVTELAQGVLQAMFIDRVKLAVTVVAAVLVVGSGVGLTALYWRGQPAAANAALVPAPKVTPKDGQAAKAVNGLQLTLSADKKETTLLADGSNAEPVQFTITFANVGDLPLKLDAYDLPTDEVKLNFVVLGPEGGVDMRDIRPLVRRLKKPTQPADFPLLDKGDVHRVPFSSHGIGGLLQIRLRKPGVYRFSVVYQAREGRYPATDFAQNIWTGSVSSNEFPLTVLPATDPKPEGR